MIMHCDLDCFFASVEMRDNPDIKQKPVIIGADPKNGLGRGVVSTCNYEARKYGLHSGMPISIAFKRCPNGIFLKPNFKKYEKASKEVMEILKFHSDSFQQTSIDEAYLEISKTCSDFNDAYEIAKRIQQEVFKKVGLTISIGCGPTKIIAKMASDYKKPNGITIVEKNQVKQFLSKLEITKIPGIGKKSKLHYNADGIYFIGDLMNFDLKFLSEKYGKQGEWIWKVINCLTENKIVREKRTRKSMSKEKTFQVDIDDSKMILEWFRKINSKLHVKLKKEDLFYKSVSIKIRFEDFSTFTRCKTFNSPIRNISIAFETIKELYNEFISHSKKVRLIGVRFSNLEKNSFNYQSNLLQFINNQKICLNSE